MIPFHSSKFFHRLVFEVCTFRTKTCKTKKSVTKSYVIFGVNNKTCNGCNSLNDTMRIITGCVKPTPTHLLPVLSGIAPAKLRRNYVSNKISYHAWVNKEHPLHSLVPDPQNLRPQRLKSRHPFYRHAAEHHNCHHDIIEA